MEKSSRARCLEHCEKCGGTCLYELAHEVKRSALTHKCCNPSCSNEWKNLTEIEGSELNISKLGIGTTTTQQYIPSQSILGGSNIPTLKQPRIDQSNYQPATTLSQFGAQQASLRIPTKDLIKLNEEDPLIDSSFQENSANLVLRLKESSKEIQPKCPENCNQCKGHCSLNKSHDGQHKCDFNANHQWGDDKNIKSCLGCGNCEIF